MNRILLLGALLICSARLFAFDIITQVQHASCGASTGSIWSYPNGGTWPYTYLWSNGSTSSWLSNVPAGIYTVTITDANSETASVDVEILVLPGLLPPMDPIEAWTCEDPCSGSISQYGIPLGGVPPYTLTFDPPGPTGGAGQSNVYLYGLCTGNTYNVTITDNNGCSGEYGPVVVTEAIVSNIISYSVSGSCPGGSTGSMTVVYDQVDSLFISGPGGWYQPTTNPFTLTNIPAGEYILQATVLPELPQGFYSSTCYVSDTIVVPESAEPCGTLSGSIYADVDGDCTQDSGEPGLPYRVLTVEPGGHLLLTDQLGAFNSAYFYGDYSLDAPVEGYESLCATLPVDFTLDDITPTASYDLALSPTFGPDVSAYLYMTGHVPGFGASYMISIQNNGPYTFSNLTVDLNYDALLSYSSSTVAPTMNDVGHLQWNIASLGAFASQNITATLNLPGIPGLLGTIVTGMATVTPAAPDAIPANDSWTSHRTITASFDPNDKTVQTSSQSSSSVYYLDQDEWIDYTIRFQNTGTATAYNVHLVDTISPLLNMASFGLLAASHPFQATLLEGRALHFHFPNIMLPDSGTTMAGSQGFISFRLRPLASVTPGMILSNAADIFFDFNETVRTNSAVLTMEQSTSMASTTRTTMGVHPNPTADLIWLDQISGMQRVELCTADGRLVQVEILNTTNQPISVSKLPSGVYTVRAFNASGTVRQARFIKP